MKPWRLFLPYIDDCPAELTDSLYQSIKELDNKRASQQVKWGEEFNWSVDQGQRRLELTFDGGESLIADPQFIGTLYDNSFMWAWNNPSINDDLSQDALRVKEFGKQRGWALLEQPQFAATPRDAHGMMALAAALVGADGAYACNDAGCLVYFTLRNLRKQSANDTASVASQEFTSPFQLMDSLISAQVANVQLSLDELRDVKAVCDVALEQIKAVQFSAAVKTLDQAWSMLGEHAVDQEPASWIKLAAGNALFLDGQHKRSHEVLTEAEKLGNCPDRLLLYRRLGQCSLAMGDTSDALDMFCRCYVVGGSAALAELSSDTISRFQDEKRSRQLKALDRVNAKLRKRDSSDLERAKATVECLIEALCEFELNAEKQAAEAEKQRTEDHVLCPADYVAEAKSNSWWTWLMATWFTPGRSATCLSRQSPPEHDPKRERIIGATCTGPKTFSVETLAKDPWEQRWRYDVVKDDAMMLCNGVFSVWDDEATQMI